VSVDYSVELETKITYELVELARTRRRRSEAKITARFGEHRAQAFARLTNPLHEHHVTRGDADAPLDELVCERSFGNGFARHTGSRVHTIPPSATGSDRTPGGPALARHERREGLDSLRGSSGRIRPLRRAAMLKAALPEPTTPELEPETGDDDDEAGDFGALLPDLSEHPSSEDDDERPLDTEPDELDTLPEGVVENDEAPNELDLGPDVLLTGEEADEAGDALGPSDGANASDLLPEDTLPSDDEGRDGIDDALPLVNDLDLPGLDADEGGEEDIVRYGTLVAASEAELEAAPVPWQLQRLSPERERCRSLALGGASIVAGSTDLLWLDDGRTSPVRVALEGTRILSLVLLGEESETVLCVTASGRLVRRARLASDAERLSELGQRAELGGAEVEGVELCQLGRATPHSVLGRGSSGLLFRSDDAGSTVRVVEPRLSVRALSPAGHPVAALSANGLELLLSEDAGMTFDRLTLDRAGRRVAGGELPGITSAGRSIAIHDAERGVAVSLDRGDTFRELAGTASVSAVTVGTLEGRVTLFLALYGELGDTTRLVRIDAERGGGEVIATLQGTGDADAELGASARIERLGWDGSRLFAAGDAGLYVLTPAPDPATTAPLHH